MAALTSDDFDGAKRNNYGENWVISHIVRHNESKEDGIPLIQVWSACSHAHAWCGRLEMTSWCECNGTPLGLKCLFWCLCANTSIFRLSEQKTFQLLVGVNMPLSDIDYVCLKMTKCAPARLPKPAIPQSWVIQKGAGILMLGSFSGLNVQRCLDILDLVAWTPWWHCPGWIPCLYVPI